MLKHAKVEHITTVTYDHQANGLVEWIVRVTWDTLEKLLRESGEQHFRDRWKEIILKVQFVIINRVQSNPGNTILIDVWT